MQLNALIFMFSDTCIENLKLLVVFVMKEETNAQLSGQYGL